jgi:hypothetical protein
MTNDSARPENAQTEIPSKGTIMANMLLKSKFLRTDTF